MFYYIKLMDVSFVQYEEWNDHDRLLLGYIKTKATPPIFYLPAEHTTKTEKLFRDTQLTIEGTRECIRKYVYIHTQLKKDKVHKQIEETCAYNHLCNLITRPFHVFNVCKIKKNMWMALYEAAVIPLLAKVIVAMASKKKQLVLSMLY